MTIALHSHADIEAYLRWLRARRLSAGTIRTARYILHGLARRAGVPILEVTREHLVEWQVARADEVSSSTVITQVVYLRAFFRWAIREGLIEVDPSEVLEAPKAPRRLPRPIGEDQLAAALSSADGPVKLILALAAFAGLRACEIASLDWSEVHLTGRTPCLRVVGKGGHERVVDISAPLMDALTEVSRRRSGPVVPRLDGRPGFNTANRVSQVACEFLHAHGIDDTLHALRHRFATAVYLASRDLRATQEACGHANPSTTAGYAAVARGSVRAAILAAGELDIAAGGDR